MSKAATAERPFERSFTRTDQVLQLAATVLFAATLAILLLFGIRGANQLQSTSSALQAAAQLSAQPQLINAELTLIQRGLETTTYIGGSIGTLEALREGTSRTLDDLRQQLRAAGLGDDPDVSSALATVTSRWRLLDQRLGAVRNRHGVELYVDTPAGSQLSPDGRATKAAVDGLLATQTQNLQLLNQGVTRLGTLLRESVDDSGFALRELLLGGAAVACVLLALMLYFGWRSRQAARIALAARRQVTNILNTVREGLFLVDRDLRVGQTYSDSLCELLRLETPAGLHMEEMLKPLVDGKTLTAALKFLGLLWKDKVHEELIESVNPLSQIEVSFGNARGGVDVRYLAFSFRRVRGSERGADRSADYILGVVADVTDRVLLARELENVKADSDSQATLQLQLLRLEGEPLRTFLASADIALRKSNAVLTGSGIEQEDLKKKLHGVFRELHAIKGEAAALALGTFVQRIHGIEDALTALRGRSQLTGNDFLPVVVRLDELINHLGQIRSMQERLATLRGLAKPAGAGEDEVEDDPSHRDTTVIPGRVVPGARAPTGASAGSPGPEARGAAQRSHALTELLRSLTQEVSRAQGRSARLVARGLEDVPPQYAATVKDICIQMIRNSIAHGIETPEQRREFGKAEEGTVQISFATDGVEEYVLTVEDDGRGLGYEQIVDKALRLGLINPQQAVTLERPAVYRLIFQPGFSTTEEVSEHAGRGVGLDAVSNRVREQGGRIGVSTAAGRYTRFRVLLPRAGDAHQTAFTAA